MDKILGYDSTPRNKLPQQIFYVDIVTANALATAVKEYLLPFDLLSHHQLIIILVLLLLVLSLFFLLKIVIIIYYLKKKRRIKDFSPPTVPKSFWPGLGLNNLGPQSVLPYLSNYPTHAKDLGYSDYSCMSVFWIAYNRRFDYKLFFTLFYRMSLV